MVLLQTRIWILPGRTVSDSVIGSFEFVSDFEIRDSYLGTRPMSSLRLGKLSVEEIRVFLLRGPKAVQSSGTCGLNGSEGDPPGAVGQDPAKESDEV